MQFYIHKTENPLLKPFIQYILFNFCDGGTSVKEVTSFANTNICLGILKGSKLTENENGDKVLIKERQITSYISGLYSRPHRLTPVQDQDEICIDFSPLGYYHFFPFRVKKYILNEDILTESFGKDSVSYFESVFNEKDFKKRAYLVETFFCSKIKDFENNFLNETLWHIHDAKGEIRIDELARKLKCNEKKVYRSCMSYFDLSPQDYIRIVKFRNALFNIKSKKTTLTKVAHQCGYYDQSHFIREIKFFTCFTPKHCASKVLNIGNTVALSIS